MPTTDEWDLTVEWLEALKVVKAAGMATSVPMLARQVLVEWGDSHMLPCAQIIYKPNAEQSRKRVDLKVNPAIIYMAPYRVERLEIFVYLAAECIAHLLNLDAPQLGQLCLRFGCANTRTLVVRERWRRIGGELDPRNKDGDRAQSLVQSLYEDRPKCGWCHGALVTGSVSDSRKDLHEGCKDYVVKVVRSQILAERRAQGLVKT